MGDLKTPWSNPVYPDTSDLGGDLATSRGNDPNADGDPGPAAIKTFWEPAKQITKDMSMEESGNSVSGLPSLPNRFEPTEQPPDPPDLTTRSPGTIDKK